MRAMLLALVALLGPAALACAQPPPPPADESARAPAAVASSPMPAPPPPAPSGPTDTDEARRSRAALLAELRRDGMVKSEAVLAAIDATPRHLFVPGASMPEAYRDDPHPIGHGQTISQPTVVGMMTEALELTGSETVLEIGTGSGWQAAVLSRLAKRVYTIELVPELGVAAKGRLAQLGYANVEVRVGDGYKGWPEKAPFDRVLVTAAPPEMPQPLVDQLAEGGILVAPVGDQGSVQRLLRLRKKGGKVTREDLGAVRFVPMVPGR